jgi:hypothetical protein
MFEEPMFKRFKIFGLIFVILAIIGLAISLLAPWYSSEYTYDNVTERNSYNYFDFGNEFEENEGAEFDDYYSGSALMAIIGFILILLIGFLLIYEGYTGKISNILARRFLKDFSESNYSLLQSIFLIFILLLLILPIILVTIGGTRFIGLTSMEQMSFDSFSPQPDYTEQSYSTTAGWGSAIIGMICLLICLIILFKEFRLISYNTQSDQPKWEYLSKIRKFALIFLVLCIIALITLPLLSFMNHNISVTIRPYAELTGWESEYEYTGYMNDGEISVVIEMISGGTIDDIYENIDRDIGIIAWSLILIIIFSILAILGSFFFQVERFAKLSHLFIVIGGITFIFLIFIFTSYGLLAADVGEMNDELGSFKEENYWADTMEMDYDVVMGWNFIPLIFSMILIVPSFFYFKRIWPVSGAFLLGKISPEATGVVLPSPGAGQPTPAQGGPGMPGVGPRPTQQRAPPWAAISQKPLPRGALIAIIIVIIIVLAGSAGAYLVFSGKGDKKKSSSGDDSGPIDYTELPELSNEMGYYSHSDENTETMLPIIDLEANITKYIYQMDLILEWQDEDDQTRRHENEPDEFMLQIISPTGEEWQSDMVQNDPNSKQGMIELTTGLLDPPVGWEDEISPEDLWTINIVCGECGDHRAQPALLMWNDTGNAWGLTISYSYYYEEVSEEGEA